MYCGAAGQTLNVWVGHSANFRQSAEVAYGGPCGAPQACTSVGQGLTWTCNFEGRYIGVAHANETLKAPLSISEIKVTACNVFEPPILPPPVYNPPPPPPPPTCTFFGKANLHPGCWNGEPPDFNHRCYGLAVNAFAMFPLLFHR